jgi:tetratricopeptide (TPR) repeat protein
MVYEKSKEFDQALKEYSVASKDLPIAYLYMGNLFFQQKDYENAEKNYKKAIKSTNDARAYNNLAWLYYTIDKNLDEALELAKKAVELSGGADEFRDTLEKITEKQKNRNQ